MGNDPEYSRPWDVAFTALAEFEDEKGNNVIMEPGEILEWLIKEGKGELASLRIDEIEIFTKLILKDWVKCGILTSDGLMDWDPALIERIRHGEPEGSPVLEDNSSTHDPVEFKTKVQKKGTGIAIYIPRDAQDRTGAASGDIVKATIAVIEKKL